LDDEPDFVPDPEASKPDDWDEEEDGEWEAPTIPNPKVSSNSSRRRGGSMIMMSSVIDLLV